MTLRFKEKILSSDQLARFPSPFFSSFCEDMWKTKFTEVNALKNPVKAKMKQIVGNIPTYLLHNGRQNLKTAFLLWNKKTGPCWKTGEVQNEIVVAEHLAKTFFSISFSFLHCFC